MMYKKRELFLKAKCSVGSTIRIVLAVMFSHVVTTTNVFAADEEVSTDLFPDTFMLKLGSYSIGDSSTNLIVNPEGDTGTEIDFQRELNGESKDSAARIDARYRFNDKHSINFTAFGINRSGSSTLTLNLKVGDNEYSVGETVNTDLDYTLYKLGYGYSFYHSPEVELTLIAGVHVTGYDLLVTDSAGQNITSSDVTVPLPMLGLSMKYEITPRWSVFYIAEAFTVRIEDTFSGNLLNYELSTEYRLLKNFSIGAGIVRFSIDVDVDASNWQGGITDSHRGVTVFGSLYF